jgi:hypothetical protein
MVEQMAADTPDVRASLALFYAYRNRADDALRMWNTLSDTQKKEYREISRTIAQALYEERAFRAGVEFSRQSGIDPDARVETITNGGFENFLANADDTFFGWKVQSRDSKVEITQDGSVKHSGTKSLRVTFRNYLNPTFYGVWQNVALRPNTKYKLSFWLRTENLKSGSAPIIEVVNAADNQRLGASRTFPTGLNDWQPLAIEFSTPEMSDGVFVRSARPPCGGPCPVVGIFWLDDFEIVRAE